MTALKEEIIKRDIQTIEEVMVTSLVLDESLKTGYRSCWTRFGKLPNNLF